MFGINEEEFVGECWNLGFGLENLEVVYVSREWRMLLDLEVKFVFLYKICILVRLLGLN